ncbi:MAG: FAD-dependent oxidoreductase, partial [Ruminococcus sp.]|nr:FAD-dependent oxidoreductase [Ruminococcus sp.]
MIRINNLHIPLDYDSNTVINKVSKTLRVSPNAIRSASIFRRSVDARKKDDIFFLCTVDAELHQNEDAVLRRAKNAVKVTPYAYDVPRWKGGASPVVVGMGPAGLFAALVLAQSGAKPVVLERGRDVDSRTADVRAFWETGKLNTSSNVQFGEGGAGTFSDGKLNTGTKDNRQRKVLEEFVRHGAPEEILYNAKPHIGTDKLKTTVKNLRKEIIALGGTVLFEAKMTGFTVKNGKISAVTYERGGKNEIIETDSVILAIGHSARDTFEMLYEKKLPVEPKPFSVGARIEHLRERIDK